MVNLMLIEYDHQLFACKSRENFIELLEKNMFHKVAF